MRFILFPIWFLLGLALVKYREAVQRFTGDIAFAEKWLGIGGTFRLYLLLGIAIMIASILYVTGTLDGFISGTFGRVFFVPGQQ